MAQDLETRNGSREQELFMPGKGKSEQPQKKAEATEKYDLLNQVMERYSKEPGQLIRILQKAQDIFGYLPGEVQAYIAEKTETPVSEVNGVVTFYSLFATEPKGKNMLNVCMGTACYVKGAQELMDALKDKLDIDEGETTPDRLFTIKSTRCVGACGLAPILVANEDVHGKIGSGDIPRILHKYQKGENIENPKH